MATAGRDTYLPSLEGLRAIAAGLVLITHAASASGAVDIPVIGVALSRGTWGVTLFFVLSGFLLTRPWVRAAQEGGDKPALRRYALLRTARILPAYWVALVAVLVAFPGTGVAGIISNVTLTQIYTGQLIPEFFQTWSLCTEVAFYVALPLLAGLLVRRSARATLILLTLVALVAPVYIYWVKESGFFGYAILWLPGHLDWFAAGMALAVVEPWLRGERRLPDNVALVARRGVWLAGTALGWALMLSPLGGPTGIAEMSGPEAVAQEATFGLAAFCTIGLLLVATRSDALYSRALATAPMQWAGRISYAVFLWQMMMLELVRSALGIPFGGGGFLITLVVAGAATVVVSQLSWMFIEKPILTRAHRLTGPRVDITDPARRRPGRTSRDGKVRS